MRREEPAQRNSFYSDRQRLAPANDQKDDSVPHTIAFLQVQSDDRRTKHSYQQAKSLKQ